MKELSQHCGECPIQLAAFNRPELATMDDVIACCSISQCPLLYEKEEEPNGDEEYDYEVILTVRIKNVKDYLDAVQLLDGFLIGLHDYVSSSDPNDDHFEIVGQQIKF